MYRRNQGGQTLGFRLVNAATGASLTGATVSGYRSIDGAAQAAVVGTFAEKGNGQYVFSPDAVDIAGAQISFLFVAAGAVPEEKTVVTTAANPGDAAAFGLSNLDAAVSSRLATGSYTAPANPTDYARNNVAPSWFSAAPTAAAVASAVWDFLQSSLGMGATMGQLLWAFAAYKDPWTADASTLLSPPPTINGFSIDTAALKGSIALPAVVAINLDAFRGRHYRVTSYNPGTGAVVLRDPLPTAPPTDANFAVEFQADNPRLLDLAQPIADVQTATVGGALNGSWAVAWGKVLINAVSKILRVWGAGNNTATPSKEFDVNDATNPTNRTPI